MLKPLAIAVMILLGSAAFAAGEVYRWKDASGVWNYSDQPHPGAEVIRRPSASSNASATPAPATAPASTATATSDTPLPVSREVAQEVRQDASAAKAKRCEKAKVDYEEMVKALRIKRADDKGNITYLTAEQMDAARLEARAVRDLACAP
jgi:pyruvate/2-oxoglutarate dehydrogenase complex dihydrolipoamide acyltransferase (E2) component